MLARTSDADERPAAPAARILIADDVPANVELLADQLATLGYVTFAAIDATSALTLAIAERPDLCILDVAMPAGALGVEDRSAGFEVCRRLKRDARTARTPVIFVTALNDSADHLKAIEAGGDDFLTKPHNRLVLGARVRALLQLKGATDALEDSYRKLRELERVRDDLMKMIVHDLKTPLSSVLATLEMLRDGDFGALNGPQDDAIRGAERRSQDLLLLMDDLLELARLDDARVPLEALQVDVRAMLRAVAAGWSDRLRQEHGTLQLTMPEDAPPLRADPTLLRRLLDNLVQNALVHSGGPVRVHVTVRRDGDGVLWSVADDGPGIPAEYREVIFRSFERVRRAEAPRVRGTGLGLSFCRLVAAAHGGRIWVQGEGLGPAGTGSTFHVWLPQVPVAREGSTT